MVRLQINLGRSLCYAVSLLVNDLILLSVLSMAASHWLVGSACCWLVAASYATSGNAFLDLRSTEQK